jgi:tRNA uridine 5-carboxymethylaminomethyl modification enzyme
MAIYPKTYDVIVVGGGHAGCEAVLAAARMGCSTLLLTISLDMVAHMPCSPSVGGVGKGHLVKEIDALGGRMARLTDETAIQYRTLNTSNGPAVWGTRTQNDKLRYRMAMKAVMEAQKNLEIKETMVEELLLEDHRVVGIRDHLGVEFMGRMVILTTGTFLGGLIHIGDRRVPAGRAGEFPANALARSLADLGFQMGRMKTGTPPRLKRSTIDFSVFGLLEGDPRPRPFSLFTKGIPLPQVPCHMGRTTEATHSIIREHIQLSPLYSGAIKGVPARYCPSLEDKVMKFPEKGFHHVILEPEGLDTQEIYASGLGNSLPYEIQIQLVRSVPGMKEAEIMRPAYAIEYDFVQPTQLWPTLETKLVGGLFLAGQVNGTSGYEEAAAQGLWAGINAALRVQGRPPFILDRSQAYMAVLVDDLVTRGVREPYRMFTSRAEYRLLLREDNADLRLMEKGYELGLIGREALEEMRECHRLIEEEMRRLQRTFIKPSPVVNAYLESAGSSPLQSPASLAQLLKRPEISFGHLGKLEGQTRGMPERVVRQVEILCKYEGYLQRQEREVKHFQHLERILIPQDLDHDQVPGLSHEVRQLLKEIQPRSLGQASRISGVTPAAISALMVYLEGLRRKRAC